MPKPNRNETPAPKLLKKSEVAARLRVAVRTVTRWVAEGAFPPGIALTPYCVRWSEATVEEFLRRQAGQPQGDHP